MMEADFEHRYAQLFEPGAEASLLQTQLQDPAFVAWLLERLLMDKPDLRVLARHILEQVRAGGG